MAKKNDIKNYGEGFRQNIEGVRTNYETYRKKNDPSSDTQQKRLDRGSSDAYESVSRKNREADAESDREWNRASRERQNRDAADGKTRLTTEDKKY